jgi:hypothetical protein
MTNTGLNIIGIKINQAFFALLIAMALGLNPLFAFGDDDDDDDDHHQHSYHNYNKCKPKPPCYCPTELFVVDDNVNLGSFFVNSRSTLPSSNGEGNIIEVILKGDKWLSYTVELWFDNKVDAGFGFAKITRWTWEKADACSWGHYGWDYNERKYLVFPCVHLYHYWCGNKCDNFARFRLTAKKIRISPDAEPGPIQFVVTIKATANI